MICLDDTWQNKLNFYCFCNIFLGGRNYISNMGFIVCRLYNRGSGEKPRIVYKNLNREDANPTFLGCPLRETPGQNHLKLDNSKRWDRSFSCILFCHVSPKYYNHSFINWQCLCIIYELTFWFVNINMICVTIRGLNILFSVWPHCAD